MRSKLLTHRYITKHLNTTFVPILKQKLASYGYTYSLSVVVRGEPTYSIKSKIYWKTNKLKTFVRCLIMFNSMYKKHIELKYAYGSDISMQAEKNYYSLCEDNPN